MKNRKTEKEEIKKERVNVHNCETVPLNKKTELG